MLIVFPVCFCVVDRQANPAKDASQQNSEMDESWDSPSEEEEALYSTTPPYTPRQMKRMSGKHQRNSQARSCGRSPNKSTLVEQEKYIVLKKKKNCQCVSPALH